MSELRAIAEAAVGGPWYVKDGTLGDAYTFLPGAPHAAVYGTVGETRPGVAPVVFRPADAVHIAAWSPDRALAALNVIEALRAAYPYTADYISEEIEGRADAALARWDALG